MPEDKEEKAREMFMEFQALEQHIKQLQKQLEMVTGQMVDLVSTSRSLDEFSKLSEGKEIFVPLSSGIYSKASIKSTDELLVNVGANVIVKKDVQSTKKLLDRQVNEIKNVQNRMMEELEKMTSRATLLETKIQSMVSE